MYIIINMWYVILSFFLLRVLWCHALSKQRRRIASLRRGNATTKRNTDGAHSSRSRPGINEVGMSYIYNNLQINQVSIRLGRSGRSHSPTRSLLFVIPTTKLAPPFVWYGIPLASSNQYFLDPRLCTYNRS